MIILGAKECPQGGSAWHKARLGIPTASSFDKILTPSTRKLSTQADGYMRTLLAEWVLGEPAGADASQFMDRGTELEPEARAWYAYEREAAVLEVGIVLRDDRMAGASPDGLVGDDGTLEIKCPGAATHVGYLLDGGAGLRGYFSQVQGAMWLTGRQWTDILSYHPTMPAVVVRIARDEEYIAALDSAVSNFVALLLRQRARLLDLGCVAATRVLLTPGMINEEPF